MRSMQPVLTLLILLAAGCETDFPPSRPVPSAPSGATDGAIGKPVLAVIMAVSGRSVQCFDAAGKPLFQLPVGAGGSVSVFDPDRTAQDNYAFDASGIVVRHLQSYGTNYSAGVWIDAKFAR